MTALMPANNQQRVRFRCPFCHSTLVRRSSWQAHPLLRYENYQCDLPTCGAAFTGAAELTHISSPSGIPDAPPSPLPPTPGFLRLQARQAHQSVTHSDQLDFVEQQQECHS